MVGMEAKLEFEAVHHGVITSSALMIIAFAFFFLICTFSM